MNLLFEVKFSILVYCSILRIHLVFPTVYLQLVSCSTHRWGEAYTWSNVNCCVHNVIVGKLWIEQYGNMEVVCHGGAGLKANLCFKPAGFNNRDLHRVDGFIVDPR